MGPSTGISSVKIPWAWILAIAGIIFYIPFIGGVSLFDWDEINFAEISREMMVRGDYLSIQVNYKPFFEKPPFFFWLQVVAMKVFGINEFAARLPNALAGIFILVLLLKTGTRWIDRRFGIFWALSYMGSILPAMYHKSGIIDPWFNLFIFGSLIAWVEGSKAKSTIQWFLLAGVLSGMAVLTKGPVGPLLIGMTVLIMRIWSKNKHFLTVNNCLIFILGNSLVAGLWFGVNWISNGPEFIMAFLKYQAELLTESVAGHKGFPGYHFAVALFGIFPASLFALAAFKSKGADENTDTFQLRLLMIILTTVVLVLFSVVQSKIVHYSSLIYYPVSFLSAWTICRVLEERHKWTMWHIVISLFVAFVICLAVLLLPIIGINIDEVKDAIKMDAFSRATLEAEVKWGIKEFIPAIWLISILSVFVFLWKKFKREVALVTLFFGIGLFVTITLVFFIGKIESYSQHAAVEFCESKAGQQVEIQTIGFKSYLPYFYAKKPAPDPRVAMQDLPHFYILRADKRKKLDALPELEILYEKNGFIFLGEK